MSAILVLILRILLAALLYAFLGWTIYTLWRELREEAVAISGRKIPPLNLTIQVEDTAVMQTYTVPEVVLGRDDTCDCVLSDEVVSARHLRFSYHQNHWWLEDLLSTNGTFLNDERVLTPTIVMTGDQFRAGLVEGIITIGQPEAPKKS